MILPTGVGASIIVQPFICMLFLPTLKPWRVLWKFSFCASNSFWKSSTLFEADFEFSLSFSTWLFQKVSCCFSSERIRSGKWKRLIKITCSFGFSCFAYAKLTTNFLVRLRPAVQWYFPLQSKWLLGRSLGLVVMGEDSCLRDCGFESQRCILDGRDILTLICRKNCIVWLKKPKMNGKDAG